MEQKIILLILFLFSIFKLGYSMKRPTPIDVIYDEKSFTFIFNNNLPYFTRLLLYKDKTTPRGEMAPNYFNCSQIIDGFRHCLFHSEEPFSRLWGSIDSKVFGREELSTIEDCSFDLADVIFYPKASNLKYSKKPKTSGEDIIITGSYLRFMGGPNLLLNTYDTDKPFVVKGNFSDPSFDCNNITVTFSPGSGTFRLYYDETGLSFETFSYESPKISSTVFDSSKQIITIIGDNFFTDKKLVTVSFDGINQPNFIISVNHTQIQVNNFSRVDPGPMSVRFTVDDATIEKSYIHCFPAKISSISSVSNHLGGIVTIKGEKLSSTLNSSLAPSITIGDKQCTFIKSTSTELECSLVPNDFGGKNLPVDVNFGGCNSTSPNGVSFTYNIPILSSGSYSNGIVTLIGTNLGTNNESSIQLYGDRKNDNKSIDQFNVSSSDEKSLTFELPRLRCKSFNISLTRSNITSNTLSISASLSINVINRPTVSNGTLNIEIYFMDCPISSPSAPSITIGDSSSATQCSIPSLQSSTSDFYETICSTPYDTVESRKISGGLSNIIFNGNNFGNSTSLIKVYLNGSDISSEILESEDHQLTIKLLDSYENGPINITVDGNNMDSLFNLTLPPVIYGIINKDNKTLACRGLITVSGKNLLTNDNEFKVKVLANNKIRAESKEGPLFVSTFIGDSQGPKATLTCYDPKISTILLFKNKKEGIKATIGGISLTDNLEAKLQVPSENFSLSCDLQCSSSPNDILYYNDSNISSSETDITNSTDSLSCHSKSYVEETSGVLHLRFGSTSFHYNVKIEKIELSPSPSIGAERNSKSSKLSDGAIAGIVIGCIAAVGCLVGCFFYFKITTRVKNFFK
ncbi:hypothetical protein ACTFIY_010534 [Dictyostelium cf. discoideum]